MCHTLGTPAGFYVGVNTSISHIQQSHRNIKIKQSKNLPLYYMWIHVHIESICLTEITYNII